MQQIIKNIGGCCAGLLVAWCLSAQPTLTRVEYYVDSDPGYGKGTAISYAPGNNLANIPFNLNPTTLSFGVHTVGIRAKDANNAWGQDNKFVFAKPYPAGESTGTTPNLSRVEYYIDIDPGYDKATAVPFTASTNLSDVAIKINPATLTNGVHVVGIRAKDAKGAWSQDNKFVFAKPYPAGESMGTTPKLSRVEYYVDTDPGYGKATAVPFTAGTNLSDISVNLDPATFASGIHVFGIRSKDANRAWSQDNKWLFARPYPAGGSAGSTPTLVNMEYYIDKDPGYGKGIPVAIKDGNNLSNLNLAINITGLDTGMHRVFVRSKDSKKAWSLDNTFDFRVDMPTIAASIVLNSVSRRTVCPPDTLKIAYEAKGTFNAGNIFNVQMSDTSGSFASPLTVGSYAGTANSIITCAIPDSIVASSKYKLRVVSTNPVITGIAFKDAITVKTTHPLPIITPAGNIDLCAGSSIPLIASSGFSAYLWSSGQTSSKITVTTAGAYKVKVTDANGCIGFSATDTVKLIRVPDTTSEISGPIAVAAFQSNLSYSVTSVPGVNYTWTVPAGDTITSGQGTAAITVKWGDTSGIVSVTASNSCGTSVARQLSVTVTASAIARRSSSSSSSLKGDVGLYPNPTNSIATIVFTGAKADKFFIKLKDNTGKILLIKTGKSLPGINRVALDVGHFSNGIYIVNLRDKQGIKKSMKLNKQGF